MLHVRTLALAALAAVLAAAPALAQTTTLTMSSWVSPQHHLTANVLQGWATEAEKATSGRVKFTMLPKHPSAPPGTFDAVRDGLVDLSFVTASYTPARHILPLLPELPGSGDTALVNSVAYSRIHWKYFQKVGEYKRSEEHTSELQSRLHLVCRLLLEKKKYLVIYCHICIYSFWH